MNKKTIHKSPHIQKYFYKNTISYILLLNSSFMLPQSARMNRKKGNMILLFHKIERYS